MKTTLQVTQTIDWSVTVNFRPVSGKKSDALTPEVAGELAARILLEFDHLTQLEDQTGTIEHGCRVYKWAMIAELGDEQKDINGRGAQAVPDDRDRVTRGDMDSMTINATTCMAAGGGGKKGRGKP